MRRRRAVEIEVDHDRWLVSYSDFVTLLFAFFVVMYSISQVNEGKYKVLSSELLEAFHVTPSSIKPIQIGDPTLTNKTTVIDQDNTEQKKEEKEGQQESDLDSLSDQFVEQFSDLLSDDTLKVFGNELWLEIELDSNVLFSSGQATPSNEAESIFEDVAGILSQFNNPIQVEGFTDNVPISNQRFSNNWELSSARAASVVELLESYGIAPQRLSAVGYGEHRPVADNSTAEGRSENRRVVLMISKAAIDRPRLGSDADIEDVLTSSEKSPIESEGENEGSISELESASKTEDAANDPEEPLIAPIKLDNGGLLFTSDPELRRSNLTGTDAREESSDGEEP